MCLKPPVLEAQPGQAGSVPPEVHISIKNKSGEKSSAACRMRWRVAAAHRLQVDWLVKGAALCESHFCRWAITCSAEIMKYSAMGNCLQDPDQSVSVKINHKHRRR